MYLVNAAETLLVENFRLVVKFVMMIEGVLGSPHHHYHLV